MIFIDTWAFKALYDKKDYYHNSSKILLEHLWDNKIKILTTDYILEEAISILGRKSGIKAVEEFSDAINNAESSNFLEIFWITKSIFYKSLSMKLKFKDKPDISFTDFTTINVMAEEGLTKIFTEDKHFENVNLGFKRIMNVKDLNN